MPTFSSVTRKQRIAPRAGPHRKVQHNVRDVPKQIAPTETLTPEHDSDSPAASTQAGSEVVAQEDTVQRVSAANNVQSVLTPPATATGQPSPTPSQRHGEPNAVPVISATSSADAQVAGHGVLQTQHQTYSGSKRKAQDTNAVAANGQAVEHESSRRDGVIEAVSSRPAKRQKKPPHAAAGYLVAGTSTGGLQVSPQPEGLERRSTPAQRHSESADTDTLLQRSRAGLNAVSNLASTIEARNTRSRSRQATEVSEAESDGRSSSQTPLGRRAVSRGEAIAQAAEAIVEDAVGRGRKRRRKGRTPEDAEAHEIDPEEVTMNDLTKDSGLGKRSETGRRLEEEWAEIRERWNDRVRINREMAKERSRKQQKPTTTTDGDGLIAGSGEVSYVPEMQILGGQIVVTGSREVEFSGNVQQRAVLEEGEAKSDEAIYKYVNSNRIGKNAGLRGTSKFWDEEADQLFYKGLRMFGTDFEMIAGLFQGTKTRKEVKNHYVLEERYNLRKVMEHRGKMEQITMPEYEEMVGQSVFLQPGDLEAELAAEEKRLRDEADKMRAQNEYTDPQADIPIPSTEVGHDVDGVVRNEGEDGTAEPETVAQRLARAVVERVGQPKQKRQQNRKQRDTSSRAPKGGKKGRKPLEGVEEMIGSLDDVAR